MQESRSEWIPLTQTGRKDPLFGPNATAHAQLDLRAISAAKAEIRVALASSMGWKPRAGEADAEAAGCQPTEVAAAPKEIAG